jgi:hypothetical protein
MAAVNRVELHPGCRTIDDSLRNPTNHKAHYDETTQWISLSQITLLTLRGQPRRSLTTLQHDQLNRVSSDLRVYQRFVSRIASLNKHGS